MEYRGFEIKAKVVQEARYEVDEDGGLLRRDTDSVEEPTVVGFVAISGDGEEFDVDSEIFDDALDEVDALLDRAAVEVG